MSLFNAPYQYLSAPGDTAMGMDLHAFSLAFKGNNSHLEQPFLEEHAKATLNHVRVAVLFGSILMAAFGFLDAIVIDEQLALVVAIRYGLLVPGGMLIFAMTYTQWFQNHSQVLLATSVALMGVGLTSILIVAPVTATTMYFAGNMLVIFFAYSFLGLRIKYSTLASWLIVIAFPVAALAINHTRFDIVFTNLFFTVATSVLGMFVGYSMEFQARRNFFLRQVLQGQKEKILEARDDLEIRVAERTQEALAAARSKSEFLANMSHEIRTPMNGVLGMLDLLRNSELNKVQHDQLEVAFRSGENLLQILNGVLDLSKIEAGKMVIEQESTAPGFIIEDVCSLMHTQSQAKQLQLITIIHPSAFETYLLDPVRFRQILLNLLGNAIKFTDHGQVIVHCKCGPDLMELEVRDTGIGIEKDKLSNLFEAFNQGDNSASRRFGGTGLGLTITKQLIELMQGNIHAESVYGEGSTFFVKLPLTKTATKDPQSESLSSLATNLQVKLEIESAPLRESLTFLIQRLGGVVVDDTVDCNAVIVEATDGNSREKSLHVKFRSTDSQVTMDKRNRLHAPITLSQLADTLIDKSIAETQDKNPVASNKYSDLKVLLVEDNVVNQKVATAMLDRLGVQTDVADDGQRALEEVASKHYDLILMDCQMPEMDGFETTKAIRNKENKEQLSHTVIVALTANAMEGDQQRCIASGMDDYLAKPIDIGSLDAILQRWSKFGSIPN